MNRVENDKMCNDLSTYYNRKSIKKNLSTAQEINVFKNINENLKVKNPVSSIKTRDHCTLNTFCYRDSLIQ